MTVTSIGAHSNRSRFSTESGPCARGSLSKRERRRGTLVRILFFSSPSPSLCIQAIEASPLSPATCSHSTCIEPTTLNKRQAGHPQTARDRKNNLRLLLYPSSDLTCGRSACITSELLGRAREGTRRQYHHAACQPHSVTGTHDCIAPLDIQVD